MSVIVQVEDREGEANSRVVEILKLHRHFQSLPETVCLGFISEEEDASFNCSQAKLLSGELEQLRGKELKKEEQDELAAITPLCRKVAEGKGLYLRFYGESD